MYNNNRIHQNSIQSLETSKTPEREFVKKDVSTQPKLLVKKGRGDRKPPPDRRNPIGVACCLLLSRFMPVPLNDELKPKKGAYWQTSERYTHAETPEKTWDQIRTDFYDAKGIAIKCGKVSNLIVIDVDDPERFNRFYPIEKLKREAGYVVQSRDPGHYHFGFAYEEEFNSYKKFDEEAGFEIKTNGGLINIFSEIPGMTYTIEKFEELKPMPEELRRKIRELINGKKGKTTTQTTKPAEPAVKDHEERARKILEILEPYYNKGQRHSFALGVAGIFRTAGIPESVATDVLLDFCKRMGDREISDRRRAIQDTYNKSENEPITGYKYLEEKMGVDGWHIEQLKELIGDSRSNKTENTNDTNDEQEEAKEKSPLFRRALKLLEEEGVEYWMTDNDEPFVSVSPTEHFLIKGANFERYLRKLIYKKEGCPLHKQTFEEVASVCESLAEESGITHTLYKRVGCNEEGTVFEVFIGRQDGKVLRITADDFCIAIPELKFLYRPRPIPVPFREEAVLPKEQYDKKTVIELFSKIFHLQSEGDYALLIAWMLKTFYPKGEYPILALLGEREGVGKTTATKFIVKLLDPRPTLITRKPHTVDDLYTSAKMNFILAFDNLSNISPELSDEFCQLATGGGISKRKLYTDTEVVTYHTRNPIILNSIFDIVNARDLRRRCVVIEMKKPEKPVDIEVLENAFQQYAPYCYGYLIRCVQEAIKNKAIKIDTPLLDVADFCKWTMRAHPVFFLGRESFIRELDATRRLKAIEMVNSNLVASFIKDKLEDRDEWVTTATELLKELKAEHPFEKSLPSNPNALAKEIRKVASDLEAVGVKVEFKKSYYGRQIVAKKLQYDQPKEIPSEEPEQPLIEQSPAPLKLKEDAPPDREAEIGTIAIINYELEMVVGSALLLRVNEKMKEVLIRRGLSVGREGICICLDQTAYENWIKKKENTVAYTPYMIDEIQKALPGIHPPKR